MPKKPDLLVTSIFHPNTIEILDSLYTTHKLWQAETLEAKMNMMEKITEDCEAIATQGWYNDQFAADIPFERVNGDFMDALPKVKIIANFGVGYDTVDTTAASKRKIMVTNTPDVLTDDVADLTMGLLLATSRRMVEADRYVREGKWVQAPLRFGNSLTGKKLGILGLGRIGEAIAQRAKAFKMCISYHNRKPKDTEYTYYSDLLGMASDCDILVVVIPGNSETEKLVNADVVTAVGSQGILINVSRGSVVDEVALIQALQEDRLGGAGLDVYLNEPNVSQELINLSDKVVLQPHQGSATHETRAAMGQLVIDNLAAYFENKPLLTPVN